MRGNAHVRFGGRAGETERTKGRHRASVRPYYLKVREGASVVSKAIVIATGVTEHGDREVLGLAVGDSEDGAFWTAFLRSLRARGLGGVRLVISDAYQGLKGAIAAVFLGSAWQRCRVHFLRNVLACIPRGRAEMVSPSSAPSGRRPTLPPSASSSMRSRTSSLPGSRSSRPCSGKPART
jgi:transposase-like protein